MVKKKNQSTSETSSLSSPETTISHIRGVLGYHEEEEDRVCQGCQAKFRTTVGRIMLANGERELGGRYCPSCQAKRDFIEAEEEKRLLLDQAAAIRRRWRETSGIPFHFLNKDFSSWDATTKTKAYQLAVKYAGSFPVDKSSRGYPSFLMFSRAPVYGVGKTHLAVSIGHRILDRSSCLEDGNPILFTTETDILLRIRATYDRDYMGASEQYIYGSIKSAALLILDDVGKEQPHDPKFTQRVYFHVIDGRYQRRLPMVITSNLDMEEIFDHIGGAATDRLFEMTQGNIVELEGKSYRRQESKSE